MQPDSQFLKSLPSSPGCYIYKDNNDKVLYVGKAINIKARVSSYFAKSNTLPAKIESMIEKASKIDYILVDSEVEAFILESNLIKKYRPKYNKLMKDDKSYIWVAFDKKTPFPKPEIVREKKYKNAQYFGPYPDKFPASKVIKRLRRIYPFCATNFKIKKTLQNGKITYVGTEKRPCLDYHIGLCSGVCAGLITSKQHKENINNIKKYFKAQKNDLIEIQEKKMRKLASDQKFEEAQEIRDQIKDIKYITQKIFIKEGVDEIKLEKEKLTIQEKAIRNLVEKLDIDKLSRNLETRSPQEMRFECYDISNIQGTNAVGSMVVFIGGKSANDQYRKFKIKSKSTPDDFLMLSEMLNRRFSKKNIEDKRFGSIPDLVIVDGGKGQLASVYKTLQKHKELKEIPLIGLAKREEEIFKITGIEDDKHIFKLIRLSRRSESLYILQRIRDEAHRFAIGYHRRLRSKSMSKSVLDDIPGVGEITKRKLIQAFGSWENIKKQKKASLLSVIKNKRTVESIIKLQ